jgi:hypothetical protein
MNLQLLLEDFLGLMREEGELDAFLPLLLSAMGHQIVFRAQKGPRQYGVDIVTVGADADGHRKLFMWLVKCGDIGRSEWSANEQSVRQSIEDVGDVYLSTHVAPQHRRFRKKLVVLTNGEYKSAIALTLSQYLRQWAIQHAVEADHINGSQLAAWTERHLLDEHALPPAARTHFRRTLALVATPEVCVQSGRELIDALLEAAFEPAKSKGATRKKHLVALRAIRTALSILAIWARREANLAAPYRLAEYALLAVWSAFHSEYAAGNQEVVVEFTYLALQLLEAGEAYHQRVRPYYLVRDGFAHRLPDSLLVNERVFSELGRLGFCGYLWAFHATNGGPEWTAGMAVEYAARIEGLLVSHTCSGSPAYDHQAFDIHAAMLCLLAANKVDVAKHWLGAIVTRLLYVGQTQSKTRWPLNLTFQELVNIQHGYAAVTPDMLETTVLVPIVALWTAALGMEEAYKALRDGLMPKLDGMTPNVWSSDAGFDSLLADQKKLIEHGVGEAILPLPSTGTEFLTLLSSPLADVSSIEASTWYQARAPYLPLLASLHWRLQVPREMLAKQVIAFAAACHVSAEQGSTAEEG